MKRFVMNSPVLTAYGLFRYEKFDLGQAKQFLALGFTSAVGHASTAAFVSVLLGVEIPLQRVAIEMMPGDQALVLRFLTRLPEGALLTPDEIAALPHEFGLLQRLE